MAARSTDLADVGLPSDGSCGAADLKCEGAAVPAPAGMATAVVVAPHTAPSLDGALDDKLLVMDRGGTVVGTHGLLHQGKQQLEASTPLVQDTKQEVQHQLEEVYGLEVLPLAPFLIATDPDVSFYNEIFHYLSNGTFPHNVTQAYRKTIKKNSSPFFLSKAGDGGLLYNHKNPKVVVVAYAAQQAIIAAAHATPDGAHCSARKTYLNIFSKYYWRTIYVDVNNYVKSCQQCREEPVEEEAGEDTLPSTIGGHHLEDGGQAAVGGDRRGGGQGAAAGDRRARVWKKVQLRVYGPFNRSLQGNEYVVALQDSGSLFVVAQALQPHSLEANCAGFLLQTFCRMGFANCQAVGMSGALLANIQSCYKSLRESCADTLRALSSDMAAVEPPGTLTATDLQHSSNWAPIEEVIEEVVSRDALSWDVEVQHQVLRHNTKTPPHGGPSPFSVMFARHPTGGVEQEGHRSSDGEEAQGEPLPHRARRRLRSATLQVFYNNADVRQVDVPSFSGSFGVLPAHVPSLAVLKPGVVTVYEESGSTKIFVSSGIITINEDSSVQLLAEEAVPVAQLDGAASRDILSKSQALVSSATSEEAKAEALIAVEVAEELVKAADG